ncbi:multimeric flavodoxin WrbA [Sphaerochaeta pleomorpha str. Grapes]|uniref:Multimeric flavodoxin WrbA n=1 Tax=Sphaerochaeta pleomorpha (strain ATCC BAA-1885 / DSM 22778 / Grapes) TaxID=158190 RepID=G8QQD7_SPHPG|nr:NAD(P)H-dependent oxidoreductase [Sphaerochaeta pleomorpha]AEV29782.1 multimeric flavodoxin WrbA [Sphaerochaeta pleomorpha str. Grapes]
MKRCSIIIHSVSGNCFIIGSYLKELMEQRSVDARLYRVEDPDLHIWANKQETTNDFYEDILALPVASLSTLLKSDMVILGSPTRFGNITAEMKTFLDTTLPLSKERSLETKFFACFTSCSHSTCEGAHTLNALIYWSQNMGMLHIPYGVHEEIENLDQPVAGIVHLAGKEDSIRPSEQLGQEMEVYADILSAYIQE